MAFHEENHPETMTRVTGYACWRVGYFLSCSNLFSMSDEIRPNALSCEDAWKNFSYIVA